MNHCDVPIAFLVFNRPETTSRVFEAIRQARPQQLLVIADGPRVGRVGEAEKCAAVRAVIDLVDWPCEVRHNYSEQNLGCRNRVASGLDWVFQQVEEAIVLEDDCLPDPTFFSFCREMLARYRDDERIMHIGGTNFQDGVARGKGSYYFSRLSHIWGWATWRRAWRHYDVTARSYPRFQASGAMANIFPSKRMQHAFLRDFANAHHNRVDTWDYQWTFALCRQNGLAVIPNTNLVRNIGFGSEATHTVDEGSVFSEMSTGSIGAIVHPEFVFPDLEADQYTFCRMHRFPWRRVLLKYLKKIAAVSGGHAR